MVQGVAKAAPADFDPSFGIAGIRTTHLGPGNTIDGAQAIAIDQAGNIYAAGTGGPYPGNFGLVKLDAAGNLASSFGMGGKVLIDTAQGVNEIAYALAVDAAGNVILAGGSNVVPGGFVVAKLDASGALMPGFGKGGTASIRLPPGGYLQYIASAVAVDRSGAIYVAGGSYIAKLDKNGVLVPDFGAGGIKTLPSLDDDIKALVLDQCGNLYVASSTFSGSSTTVQKLDFNGRPADGFGAGGKLSVSFDSFTARAIAIYASAVAIALDAAGNVYLLGNAYQTNPLSHVPNYFYAVVAIKLDASGKLVTGFGSGGKVEIFSPESARALAIDANGNWYIAGYDAGVPIVLMLDSNGNGVPDFGSSGTLSLSTTGDHAITFANAIALDASGRVVLAGTNPTAEFAIVRLQGKQVPPPSAPAQPVYRFFNVAAGAHFYTISPVERNAVLGALPQFHYEGQAYSAFPDRAGGASPVYRFFDTVTESHFFTISESEKTVILSSFPAMRLDGIAYYACQATAPGMSPVYRFFNVEKGVHFFTSSAAERDQILNAYPWFHDEGTAFFAIP